VVFNDPLVLTLVPGAKCPIPEGKRSPLYAIASVNTQDAGCMSTTTLAFEYFSNHPVQQLIFCKIVELRWMRQLKNLSPASR